MRRWNGWGEETTHYPVPETARRYLAARVGPGCVEAVPDATLEEVLPSVPASRLPAHPLITTDPTERVLHARGQSLPDWVALRSGRIHAFPDGVAYPHSADDIASLFGYARNTGIHLIPYGGGSSVVGHINPQPGPVPTLTVDLAHLSDLADLNEMDRLATFGAGVRGPALEAALNARGYTLGHFPQSFELSTLGGWVATRSSGQQSYHYGRIEDLFAGGTMVTPLGTMEMPNRPASAAGPDLRQTVLGSEGRLGIITQATVRVRRLPETEAFYGVFFRTWAEGAEAVREIAQARVPVSMLRLSDAQETETTLALSGKEQLVAWADRGLGALKYGPKRSLLIFGLTGDRRTTAQARSQVLAACRAHGGLFTGETIGKMWKKSRFYSPYLRNTLWETGYALDTLETALPWSRVQATAAQVKGAILQGLEQLGERVLVFAHLSHVYRDGASLYVTYLFRRSPDPEETLERWKRLKGAASSVIVAQGGTISHQHGVGVDHAPYLPAEKGPLGMALIGATARCLDPQGVLNPGKLIANEEVKV